MHKLRAGCMALCLSLTGQAAQASPINARQEACADLSKSTPNWQISNAASSDWPGGNSGRVELFARHVPTGVLSACDVEYRLTPEGKIVDYDPTSSHECLNFGASATKTTVQLDMDTLLLTIKSTWTCEGDETAYEATGTISLQRDTSPGACLVEPSQVGDSTTCPIADAVVEGKLAE